MKKLLLSILVLISGLSAQAQCGASGVTINPVPLGACEGDTATATFAGLGSCSGAYEFQVSIGATVVQPWTTSTTFNASPTSTTLYTVSARCNGCPATVASDTFSIFVTEEPAVSGLTSICYGTTTTLVASGYTGPVGWYDANGNQLSTTNTYTTPSLTADQTYFVQVTNTTAGPGSGSILITECGLAGFVPGADNDYIEISNLYTTPVNTTGWKVALSNSYTNINSVNPILWSLPASFNPCSIQSKQDNSSASNYWGQNILWNPNQNGWAIIIDNTGTVMDFVAWGWTLAQLASFNTTINGFNITLGTEWIGASCSSACGNNASPISISRVGASDNNTAADFTCQATSLNVLNPGLPCGWTSVTVGCSFPTMVTVDQPPTASNPVAINVECIADVPAPDPAVVTDELDDNGTPSVTFLSEVSDGLSCPETLTRTYRVQDTCGNYVDVTQNIVIHDVTAPVMDTPPANVTVQCVADVPAMVDLGWTDNCDGSGIVTGTEVSDGQSCPETLTRTWTYTDACGNVATTSQTVMINDDIAPVLEDAPANLTVQCEDDVPPMTTIDWTDNCDGTGTIAGIENSDGQSCPETITRTWSYTDNCGNTTTKTQTIIIHDVTPPTASNPANAEYVTLPPPDINIITDAEDNCGTPTVMFWSDVSDGGFCPERVTRTYRVVDDCGNEKFVSHVLTIGDEIPVASFVPSDFELTNLDTEVDFTNFSTGGATYVWNFGDGSPVSTEFDPTHMFPDDESGGYVVTLIVFSPLGCSDTMTVPIQVWEELIYYIPNTFTPDGDAYNQTFQPVFTSGYDPFNYHMWIFNRWGELVWESQDDSVGWDGTYGVDGRPVQEGTYTWKIEFKVEKNDERKTATGHVTILR